jgi:hypothetical protein
VCARGLIFLASLALILGGCRSETRDGETDPAAAVDTAEVTRPGQVRADPARAESIAAHAVTWDLAAVVAALRRAGTPPVGAQEEIRQPFLSVRGALLKIPGADVQVFLYGDASAAATDVARLDTVRVAPPTMMVSWVAQPHLVVDNNLVAIVLTDDEVLASRVRRALNASAISHGRQ